MSDDDLSGPYAEAMRRGFHLAHQLGSGCRPVHFLVGISEGGGQAAAALDPGGPGRSLRAIVAASPGSAASAGFLHMQAQRAARSFAADRGQQPGPEHLLLALPDQADPEVLAVLSKAGLDRAAVRRSALIAIGGTGEEPPLEPVPLTPAGTLDRPPLPVDDLDARAWTGGPADDLAPATASQRAQRHGGLGHLARQPQSRRPRPVVPAANPWCLPPVPETLIPRAARERRSASL